MGLKVTDNISENAVFCWRRTDLQFAVADQLVCQPATFSDYCWFSFTMCLVNSRRARLVLRWVIVSEFSSRCRIKVMTGANVVEKHYGNFEDYAFERNGQRQLFRTRHTIRQPSSFLVLSLVVCISASFFNLDRLVSKTISCIFDWMLNSLCLP